MDDRSTTSRAARATTEALTAARRRWTGWPRRTRIGVTAGAVVAAAGIAAAVALVPGSTAPPVDSEATVTAYLEAVRDRDVERALDLAGFTPADAVFLTGEAMRDDWEVTAVESTEDDRVATVAVTVESDDASVVGEFSLRRSPSGPWRMVNPFVEVAFDHSPLAYIDVNGVREPYDRDGRTTRFALFPGVYVLNGDTALVETGHRAVPLLPGGFDAIEPRPDFVDAGGVVSTSPTLTPDGEAAVTDAVDAFVADCLATTTERTERGCPFDGDHTVGEASGYEYMWEYEDMTWTLDEEPEIAIEPGPFGFAVTSVEPGRVHVEGTGLEERWVQGDGFVPEGDRAVEADCDFYIGWTDARVTVEDAIEIAVAADRDADLGASPVPWFGLRSCAM